MTRTRKFLRWARRPLRWPWPHTNGANPSPPTNGGRSGEWAQPQARRRSVRLPARAPNSPRDQDRAVLENGAVRRLFPLAGGIHRVPLDLATLLVAVCDFSLSRRKSGRGRTTLAGFDKQASPRAMVFASIPSSADTANQRAAAVGVRWIWGPGPHRRSPTTHDELVADSPNGRSRHVERSDSPLRRERSVTD